MKQFKIGELAKQVEMSIDTIRYYEKIGLIPKPERQDNEYRVYTKLYVTLLNFIKDCKNNGFTLNEIREIISLLQNKHRDHQVLESIVKNKILNIDAKIQELILFREQLEELMKFCNTGTCTINDFLQEN